MELDGPYVCELVVKKSRFIASGCNVTTIAEAMAFVEAVREEDASHNCWAYRLDESTFRYSDDGEPSGTAGKPIYSAICSSEIQNVVVVVTRYFGGTKLGAGGLIRAYNSSAAQCLQEAPRVFREPTVDLDVSVGWEKIGAAQAIVERYERLDSVFTAIGCTMTIRISKDKFDAVCEQLQDACAGNVDLKKVS